MDQFANRPPMQRQDEEQEETIVQPRCAVRDVPAQDMALTIHDAAFDGDVAKVGAFLELGVSVNAQNQNGNTPLHIASREGHADMVRCLRSQPGIDESLGNRAQQKAVDCAKNDKIRAVFAEPRTRQGVRSVAELPSKTKLHEVMGDKLFAIVAWMLVVGMGSGCGFVLAAWKAVLFGMVMLKLLAACCVSGAVGVWGIREIIKLAKREEAIDREQPLLKAVKKGNRAGVRKHLAAGLNPSGYGEGSPLHEAVIKKDPTIIRDLLNYGADPNVKDEDGYTPVFRAIMAGEAEIVKVLRSSPHTDLDIPNNEGQTARAFLHLLPDEKPSVLFLREAELQEMRQIMMEMRAEMAELRRAQPVALPSVSGKDMGPTCAPKPPGTPS